MTTIGVAAAGAWLWGKFGENVIERAGKVAGTTADQAWSTINWQVAAERYRGEMQLRYGTMRIIGMPEPVALADIFTDVYLLDKPSAWRRYNIEELQQRVQLEPETVHQRDERRDGLTLVQSHERLMILGKPGAGKTTLLKHLVLRCTTGKLDAVPIFVSLKAWADSNLALMPFLVQQFAICAFPDAQPFIKYVLTDGQALVLFDGLDEVNLEQGMRERITREVRNFADQYPRSHCVMTCRTAASEYQFERFAYCELADFTSEQMQTFVSHWFQRDAVKRKAFLTEFAKDDHDRLRDLARTPLLLTLLCLTFDETMTFPARRAEIYEEALDALLKKWDASRSITRDTAYRTLSLGHKRQMLSRIAFETFAANALLLPQEQIAQYIVDYVRQLPNSMDEIDGEDILHAIEAQHGLFIERAQRIYSFSHLTFQEYFAARYIVAHPSKRMFRDVLKHAHDVRWREVLLLTASMLEDENAANFFAIFDTSLQERVHSHSGLRPLFQWLQQKAERMPIAQRTRMRQLYMLMVVAEILATNTLQSPDNVINLELDIQPPVDPSIDTRPIHLATIFTHIARSKFTLDYVSASNVARFVIDQAHQPISSAHQGDLIWIGFLIWIQVTASDVLNDEVQSDYDELVRIWHQQRLQATSILNTALRNLNFPASDALQEEWMHFVADVRTALVTHQDIGHTWIQNRAQLALLGWYLSASERMLECLDLAAVADRDAIRNRVLLPPSSV